MSRRDRDRDVASFRPGDKLWATGVRMDDITSSPAIEVLIAAATQRKLRAALATLRCQRDPRLFRRIVLVPSARLARGTRSERIA